MRLSVLCPTGHHSLLRQNSPSFAAKYTCLSVYLPNSVKGLVTKVMASRDKKMRIIADASIVSISGSLCSYYVKFSRGSFDFQFPALMEY